jgi:hypothetical protein
MFAIHKSKLKKVNDIIPLKRRGAPRISSGGQSPLPALRAGTPLSAYLMKNNLWQNQGWIDRTGDVG